MCASCRLAGETVVAVFAKGSKAPEDVARPSQSADTEKAQLTGAQATQARTKEQTVAAPKMNDTIFSWNHLDYSVPIPGGQQRQLLNDISGFVVPGKLTALMGESGAGKVSHDHNIVEGMPSNALMIDDPLERSLRAPEHWCSLR